MQIVQPFLCKLMHEGTKIFVNFSGYCFTTQNNKYLTPILYFDTNIMGKHARLLKLGSFYCSNAIIYNIVTADWRPTNFRPMFVNLPMPIFVTWPPTDYYPNKQSILIH